MRRITILLILFLSLAAHRLFAAVDHEIAVVTKLHGMVTAGYAANNTRILVTRGDLLMNRAIVRTGTKGMAQIRFVNGGTTVLVCPQSEIIFMASENDEALTEAVRVVTGQMIIEVHAPYKGSFDIATPATIMTAEECVALVTHENESGNSAVFLSAGSCRIADPGFSQWIALAPPTATYVHTGSPFVYTSALSAGDNARLDAFVKAARSMKIGGVLTHTLSIKPDTGGTVFPGTSMTTLQGYAIELAAQPDSGYVFSKWELLHGAAIIANTAAESTTVTVASDALIAARFTGTPAQLVIDSKGNGKTVPDGNAMVPRNQPYKISALPFFGYRLKQWRTSPGVKVVAQDSASATIVADVPEGHVTAQFSRRYFTCDISGMKGGSVKPGKKVKLGPEDSVTVTAIPKKDYSFIRWEITEGKAAISNPHAPKATIRCDSSDARVRARFNKTNRTASVSIKNHERADITPSGTVVIPAGEVFTLTTLPQQGYQLEKWTVRHGDVQIDGTENARVRPHSSCELVPVVTTRTFNLTIGAHGPGSALPSGISRVFYGTPVTITAIPQEGKRFATWRILGGDVKIADKTAMKTTVSLSSTDAIVAAEFAAAVCTLTVDATAGGYTEPSGPQIMYEGKAIGLKAIPNPLAAFLGWSLESGGKNIDLSDTLTAREQMVTLKKNGNAKMTARFSTEAVELVVLNNGLGTTDPSKTVWIPQDRWIPIKAVPAEGNTFVQWVTVTGTQPAIRDRFTMETEINPGTENVTIKALFASSSGEVNVAFDPQNAGGPFVLTVIADPHQGTVDPAGPVTLQPGMPATLTATAAAEYYFYEWVVDKGTAVIADRYNRTTTVTLTQSNATVEARFAQRILQTIEAEFVDPAGQRKSIIVQYR